MFEKIKRWWNGEDIFHKNNPNDPVIFIGYSLSDPNIRNLLFSITNCMTQENINKLRAYPMLEIGLLSNNKEIITALINKKFEFVSKS